MPLRIVPDIKADDRHPPSEKEKRAQRQKEYMKKHGPQQPRRKTLAVTDKYKEVRKKLKPTGTLSFSKMREPTKSPLRTPKVRQAQGGRASKQGGGRTRLLEELGRVEAEPSNRNRRAEISRVHGELNRGYKVGGRAKGKEGIPGKKWKDKWKDYKGRRLPVGAEGIFGLGVKGKPHSSPEGRKATSKLAIKRLMGRGKTPGDKLRDRLKDLDKGRLVPDPRRKPGPRKPVDPRSPYVKDRIMTPLRAKKAMGGIAKIIGKKSVDWIKKNRKTIKKEIYSPEGKKKTQDLTKKLQEGLKKPGHAKGRRIRKGHGGSAAQQHYLQHGYGPYKSSGKVLKGKKVGIQIK